MTTAPGTGPGAQQRHQGPPRAEAARGASAGPSTAPRPPTALELAVEELRTPAATGGDSATTAASLEALRQHLLQQAIKVAAARRQLDYTLHEYNVAHGLAHAGNPPSRLGQVRRREGDLGGEVEHGAEPTAQLVVARPTYSTPVKNMRAAEAAAAELPNLQGEELRQQTQRVVELLAAGNRQQADYHASSLPHPSGRTRDWRGGCIGSCHPKPRDPAAGGSRRNQPSHHQPAPAPGARGPIRTRLGPRVPPVGPTDARSRLDRLAKSRLLEEEGPAGPICFGPRIMHEPIRERFSLPRGIPKYNGTTKPEDWLVDYTTAVGIAGGNKRWAVRYAPLMLTDSARTWLNGLPAGSINSWLDFEEAFVSNFTGTYRRPGHSQQLSMCV